MKASVIIPTCDRPNELDACLSVLVPQVKALGECEILVCDDSRMDETRALMKERFPGVIWHAGPRRGPAANRNSGASKARGEWLIFLDDDCVPCESYLNTYLHAMDFTPNGMVALEGPTLRTAEPPSLLWEAPHNPDGGILISCNFSIRRDAFMDVGCFDERYPVAACEDTEFAERFRLTGGQVRFVPEAKVAHPLRPLPPASRLAARWEGKAIYAFDQGAGATRVLIRLPWHCLRVIQSRFRSRPWTKENITAACLFAMEWSLVAWKTPGWVRRCRTRKRNAFWVKHVSTHGPAQKFGF